VERRDQDELILKLVTQALESLGFSPPQLAALVENPDPMAPASGLVDVAANLTENPDLGLDLAYATTIRLLSPVVYLMVSGPNLGAALHDMTRYAPVAMHRPTSAVLLVEKHATTFVFGPEPGGRAYSEYLAALLMRLFRYVVDTPELRPVAARFTHPAPADLELRREIFGPDLRFSQPRNALVFSPEQLRLPCPHASALLHTLHERALHEALQAELEDTLLARVRVALADGLAVEAPTTATVARTLGLSERTLQRRLKQRGTSFERLLVEVRRQRMLQLLAQHSLSVEAVAHATGYRDPSSFHRAFRAWTGVTPAVYRGRLKAGVLDATVAPRAVQGPLRPRRK
jgi:AraC-like DNA-binding protein